MARSKNIEFEQNQIVTPLPIFIASYNSSLPAGFPRASAKMLKKFQATHPSLFKNVDQWSITKHRKKLMDWLSSYRDDS